MDKNLLNSSIFLPSKFYAIQNTHTCLRIIFSCMHAHTHILAHTHTQHTHTHTCAHTHTTHTHMLTHHFQLHAHTRTHAHAHTQSDIATSIRLQKHTDILTVYKEYGMIMEEPLVNETDIS